VPQDRYGLTDDRSADGVKSRECRLARQLVAWLDDASRDFASQGVDDLHDERISDKICQITISSPFKKLVHA
jgi:hypothetical protein